MVVKKGDIHSKISSRLWQLGKGYENRTMSAQAYAQSKNLRTESPDKITVYLLSEPGTIIDETTLQAYGGEIIKSADNVWKVGVPINMIETIADNVKGISFIKLPDRAKPSAIESEGVGLTGASSYARYPAVVMVTGSGYQNRDHLQSRRKPVCYYKPFRQIADAISRKGIAVLRMDDQGVGCSEGGPLKNVTIQERADDNCQSQCELCGWDIYWAQSIFW